MGAEGTEHLLKLPEKPHTNADGGAKSGAGDDELAQVNRLWQNLPAPGHSAIIALAKAAAKPPP